MRQLFFLVFYLSISANLFAQSNVPGPGACGNPFNKKSVNPLNGNGSLGQIYNNSACGLNYVHGDQLIETRTQGYGFNTNGTGLPTTITITGLPACNTIVQAYLWYFASYQSASAPTTSVNITNPIGGNNVYNNVTPAGTSGDVCWAETGTAVYRADVTTNISGNGVYTINLTGFSNPNWEVDGATLFIIYRDLSATYQGSIIINDGDMACGSFNGYANPQSQTMSGFNVCAASNNASAFAIAADMQGNINGGQHPATLNGATANYPNNFWCFDQTNTSVTAGQTTAQFTEDGLGFDCYIFGVIGLYYQTTTCTTCTPSAISLTVTPTNSTCGNPNGSAVAVASGTSPPFTYLWSTGATTTSISNLAAGSYTATVTNAVGCSTVQTFSISTSVGPNVSFTTTPSICTASNGSATLTASGGAAPYTYAWITPANTTTTVTGLASGTYSVAVSDASGCSNTYTTTVPLTMNTVSVTPAQINDLCFGSSNGSASATPSGGTAPYTYAWSNGSVTSAISNLIAQTYSVTITDSNGCTQTASVTITQPTALTATASVVNNALCFNSTDGSAIAGGAGGTAPYTYGWTPTGQNTQTATGLSAGTYNVIVTDANGCTNPQTVNITQPAIITLSNTTTIASCGISDGSATATAAGGTAPYTYLWLGVNPAQTSQTLTNVPAGTYNAVVTDANGCNMQMSVTVPSTGPPVANFLNNPDTVSLLDASIYFLDISTNAYTWFWNFGDSNDPTTSIQQNPIHTYSDTGIYCITLIIADAGGVCRDTTIHCIKVEAPFTFYIPNAFTPNSDGINEMFTGMGTYIKEYKIWIFDRWGNLIWKCQTNGEPQLAPNCNWDGKVKRRGDIVEEDVYVWKVEIVDTNGKQHKYIGHVSMVK
ncbi:MAG: gliding motility-associated C-terminal domain-containing protein [Bacteroidetes bacterium]|nr:gliding motility-associated C-terminal domain-containing protein [Bacteroidota bacterium]